MGAPPKGSACSTLTRWESNRLARRYACSHQLHRGTSGRGHLLRLRRPRATQIARCSTHHFQQMFSHHTGVPLPGNVRHRRPTLIVFELRAGKCMVIDAPPKYGSEPPKALSRALKNCTALRLYLRAIQMLRSRATPKIALPIAISTAVSTDQKTS